jgi:hypothetical protein
MEFLIYVLAIGLYFLPTIIAYNKSFIMQVFLLNLLLGWTVIGWVIAIIWAVKEEKKPQIQYSSVQNDEYPSSKQDDSPKSLTEELKLIQEMKENGILNDDEFNLAKAKILSNS